jgi:hypothetical protein
MATCSQSNLGVFMNSCTGENLRVRLIGIKTPRHVIKTIHRCTILNASELRHLLLREHLETMFTHGAGIQFDFLRRDKIIMRPEEQIVACINGEPMLAGCEYSIVAGDIKNLIIGNTQFRLDVFRSHFPAEIIRKKGGFYDSDKQKR